MTTAFALPEGYRFEPDPSAWDRDAMHAFLETTYWSADVSRERRERGFDNSLGIAVFCGDYQVGYARAVTDKSRFAYVADVYVEDAHSRRGIARAMMDWLHRHPDLAEVTNWLLVTRDAASVYAGMGYGELINPERFMQRRVVPE